MTTFNYSKIYNHLRNLREINTTLREIEIGVASCKRWA